MYKKNSFALSVLTLAASSQTSVAEPHYNVDDYYQVTKEGRIYLDLESEQDRAKLSQAELYLSQHEDKLVILDEVQRAPELFQNLRGLIDQGRRKGS